MPATTLGQLFLAAMPGRDGPFEEESRAIAGYVDVVICLTPPEEIQKKSRQYAEAMAANKLPWETRHFEIEDFGVPPKHEWEEYLAFVKTVAEDLNEGARIMIHCGAGIGRTGTFATGVVMALGPNREEALTVVRRAGGRPETAEQRELIRWMAARMGHD